MKKALLIIDVQNDFCSGGALPVPNGDKVVESLNKYIKIFLKKRYPIFASRDWHPRNSKHFKKFGGLWPVHCVQRTKGARFHPRLKLPESVITISKGQERNSEGYSDFEGRDKKRRLFTKILKDKEIDQLFIGGLATDYCVQATVLDALKEGLRVGLLMDAIRGVDLRRDDSKRAIRKMVQKGARRIKLNIIQSRL